MSHSLFQPTRIAAFAPTPKALSSKRLLPTTLVFRSSAGGLRKCCLTVGASSSAVVDGGAIAGLERCFQASPSDFDAPSLSSCRSADFGPFMKGQYGAFGAVTLEKSKPDFKQKQTKSSPEVKVTCHGFINIFLLGGGGDIGKGLNLGGGDGGDDSGDDDDDYFDDFDDGDEGDEGGPFRRRIILPEGLVSSAQMVRFLAINARPTAERFISRCLPQGLSRAFIGRMIADPAFLYRLLLEQAATIGCSVWWEIKNRGERIKKEWDLALINVLTATTCNAIVVWSLAPCRSLSVTIPSVNTNALGYGAFLGLYANLRYQLLCGFDRAVTSYFNVIGVALFFSSALRVLNVQLGETSRLAWLGGEVDPLAQSDDLLKAYNRSSGVVNQSSSNWFISKNAIVSGRRLLGIRQEETDSNMEAEACRPKARRKRTVRRKVTRS
ncbi:UNVERIFIED_CONTAM: hypothetical protein Slati_0782800 [Sesamum latifolium]|uniref:Uncharacterized protein n=1 Tax=Sesamum latifolium TaxID=2727402 RepID=A0AAW2XQ97_9LAMI